MSAVKFWSIAKTTLKTEIKGGAGFESKLFICFYLLKNKILIVIHRKSYYAIKISQCLLGMNGFIKWVKKKKKKKKKKRKKKFITKVMYLELEICSQERQLKYMQESFTVSTMRSVQIPRV